MATHSRATNSAKNSSDEPRSFSDTITTSDTPHASSTGPRCLRSGRWMGPMRWRLTAEQLALLHEVRGEEHGEQDLGELAGLEADRPDADPDLGAVDGLADAGDEGEEQQADAAHPDRPAVALEVAHPADDEQGDDEGGDADGDPARLQAGQALRVGLGLVDADDEHVAEPVQQAGDRHERAVGVGGEAPDGEVGGQLQARARCRGTAPMLPGMVASSGQAGEQVGADRDERAEHDEPELGVACGRRWSIVSPVTAWPTGGAAVA